MTPTAYEAALVLGKIPYDRIQPFHRHMLMALDVATPIQRTALAQGFPGLVVAWTMKHGSQHERDTLKALAG